MPNVNTVLRYLPGAEPNANLVDLSAEFRGKSNAAFIGHVAGELKALAQSGSPAGTKVDDGGVAAIVLAGGYGLVGYRLRRAQEVIRLDGTPSHWSHAALVATPLDPRGTRRGLRATWVWESTIEPAAEFNLYAERSGASPRRLSDYAVARYEAGRPHCVPNIAVIALALTPAERRSVLEYADNPDIDRMRYDLPELLAAWYGWVLSGGAVPNPLTQGVAMPSAAYVQLAYDAAGIDLGLGGQQPNVTPEHIWQSAKYLGDWCRVTGDDGTLHVRPMHGWYCVRDRACRVAPDDVTVPVTLSGMVETVRGGRDGRG